MTLFQFRSVAVVIQWFCWVKGHIMCGLSGGTPGGGGGGTMMLFFFFFFFFFPANGDSTKRS